MQNMQKCFILLDRHAPRQCSLELLQPEGLHRHALPAGVAAAAAAVAGGSGGTGAVRLRSGCATGSPWLRWRDSDHRAWPAPARPIGDFAVSGSAAYPRSGFRVGGFAGGKAGDVRRLAGT
jgi:hypothetical protein